MKTQKLDKALDTARKSLNREDTALSADPLDVDGLKWEFVKIARAICPDFKIEAQNRTVINDIFRWCLRLPGELDVNKSLWLHGDIGTGKSTMLLIVRAFCERYRPMPAGGRYSFRISNAIEVCGDFSRLGYEGIDTYIDSDRQAFDELGSESKPTGYYGNQLNVFQYILQRRYDRRFEAFTHVTTNLTVEEIASFYGDRISDRCVEMFNFVLMEGYSWRK